MLKLPLSVSSGRYLTPYGYNIINFYSKHMCVHIIVSKINSGKLVIVKWEGFVEIMFK